MAEAVVQLFEKYDLDKSGDISAKELTRVLRQLNPNFTEADCSKMFEHVDVNHDGQLQYGEFIDWITADDGQYRGQKKGMMLGSKRDSSANKSANVDSTRRAKLRGKFAHLDKNGNGSLDFCEVIDFLSKRYPKLQLPDLKFLYDCADKSHDGQLDFLELLDLLCNVPAQKLEKGEHPAATHPYAAVIHREDEKAAIQKAHLKCEEDHQQFAEQVHNICQELQNVRDDDARHKKFRDAHAKEMRKLFAKEGVLYK